MSQSTNTIRQVSKAPQVKSRFTLKDLQKQIQSLSEQVSHLTSRLNYLNDKPGAVADRLSPEGFWEAIKVYWEPSDFSEEFTEEFNGNLIFKLSERTLFELAQALNTLGAAVHADFKQGRNAIVYKSVDWPTVTIENVPGVINFLGFISVYMANYYAVYDVKWQNYVVYTID